MSEPITVIWDMSRERLIREDCLWLLPEDDPLYPLYGMSKRQRRRWRRRKQAERLKAGIE